MTLAAQNLISAFESLPEQEKQEVVSVILRYTLQRDIPPISDEELALNAEEIFLELDRQEAQNA